MNLPPLFDFIYSSVIGNSTEKIRKKRGKERTEKSEMATSDKLVRMVTRNKFLGHIGSKITTLLFVWALFNQYIPHQLQMNIRRYFQDLLNWINPLIHIKFNEFPGERLSRNDAYLAITRYLSSSSTKQAKRLKGEIIRNSKTVLLTMDDREEVVDEFQGVKVWWSTGKTTARTQPFNFNSTSEERRFLKLTFHRRHRDLITGRYLSHVIQEGKAMKSKNRQRKLHTNNGGSWCHVAFGHTASFQTLAMDPEKKKEIMDDLIAFSKGEEFYARIGRAWKRGYLLYGPPGTGKSTMISAMSNLLGYDVYDLELTAVKDNTELRRLLIEISGKSVIVIEDIDCSLDVTAQRKNSVENDGDEEEKAKAHKHSKEERKPSSVTLSGLLNFIDGLWSTCGGERIIVFTTNHVEKLDPALIRKGRMDKHIELSYCSFEAFKVLAMNYLKLESHPLFPTIGELLGKINMTPADVAEHLMTKTDSVEAEPCLESLIRALKAAKEVASEKTKEEASVVCEKTEGDNEEKGLLREPDSTSERLPRK